MSRDKYREAAFDVIVDMLDLHNPDDPDLPLATAVRTERGAQITLRGRDDIDKVLASYRIELVSLKEIDEWTHVIMHTSKKDGSAVVISRHRSPKTAACHMQRRSFSRLHGYEIYRLVGNVGIVEVGDKLATIVSEDGAHLAFRPGSAP